MKQAILENIYSCVKKDEFANWILQHGEKVRLLKLAGYPAPLQRNTVLR